MSAGPGLWTSINHNGGAPTVTADLVGANNIDNIPDTFPAAIGFDVDRGSVTTTVKYDMLDYSAFTTLNTLMTGRTEHDIIITYLGAATLTLTNAILTVVPIIHAVNDACRFVLGPSSAVDTELDGVLSSSPSASGWVDLGVTLGLPAPSLSVNGDVDGHGRPYFSTVHWMQEVVLPDKTVANVESALARNTAGKAAIYTPDGNWIVLDNVRHYARNNSQDGRAPRSVIVPIKGVHTNWTSLLSYHDGSAGAATPPDLFAGCTVTAVAMDYDESNLWTYA